MAIYYEKGDGISGEILIAFFRKMRSLTTIAGTGKHRQQRVTLLGTPAKCFINKKIRSLEK